MTTFKQVEKKEDQGDWFKFQSSHFDAEKNEFVFDDPEPDAAEFCFRSMIPFFTERLKARKRVVEHVLNPQTRAMERISYYPDPTPEEQKKEQADAQDYMITGIRKAFWGEGKPVEMTREDKLKLFLDPQFDRFAGKCLVERAKAEQQEAEVTQKN